MLGRHCLAWGLEVFCLSMSPGKHLGNELWKESGHSQWGFVRDILGVTVFPMCNQHKTELCFGVTGECFVAGMGIILGLHFKQVLYLTLSLLSADLLC